MEESPGINKNHGHLKLLAPTLVTQLQGHGVYLVLTLSLPERLCILGPPELCAHGTSQIMCRWSDGEEPIHILHRSSFIHCSIRLHLQNISSKIKFQDGDKRAYLVTESCPTLCDPWTTAHQALSVHGILQEKNTGVGCHSLLQGIFPIQGSNLSFLHCRHLSQGSPPRKMVIAEHYTKHRVLLSSGDSTKVQGVLH